MGQTAGAAAIVSQTGTSVQVKLSPNLVFDGDSQTAQGGATFGEGYVNQTIRGIDSRTTVHNVAVGGRTLAICVADAAANVDPLLAAGALNICLIWAGTNDLFDQTATAAQIEANLQTYCQARKAAGWSKVIVATILPRSDFGTPGGYDTARLAVNTWLRANWSSFADGLIDPAADARVGTAGDETSAVYYDGSLIHMSNTGYAIPAALAQAILSNLGVGGIATNLDRSLWIPAAQWQALGGGETLVADSSGGIMLWNMPNTGVPVIGTSCQVPRGWQTCTATLFWTNNGAGAGTCVWRIDHQQPDIDSGGAASSLGLANGTQTGGIAAPASDVLAKTNIINAVPATLGINEGRVLLLRVLRNGGTLANAAGILGLLLEKST